MSGLPIGCVNFNQDGSCFAIVDAHGFRVFNTDPLKEICGVRLHGELRYAEPIYRSGLVALVGGGLQPAFPPEKGEQTAGILSFVVTCKRDRIVAATDLNVYVYSFAGIPECLYCVETQPNPLGIFSVIEFDSHLLIGFPARSEGFVGISSLPASPHQRPRTQVFFAHQHHIQKISISPNGSQVATASSKGTLVRLFDLSSMALVAEFRRGSGSATISCISFSPDSSFVCVASNRQTLHLFSTAQSKEEERSSFIERYTGRQSRFRLNRSGAKLSAAQLFFGLHNVIAIDCNGNYEKFDVNLETRECLNSTARAIHPSAD
ncbi:hypothetical protein M3Y99_00315200 [Aphelenchoides fujianensis]|nr:hypothetical protein M3Y99_00315200 [Aphelenchoides fujianensis]